MTYGQKYQMEFTDLDNHVILVIISQDGFTGGLTTIIASADPFVTKLDKQRDDRFEQLKPTAAEINIFVDEAGDYDEFYDIDNFEYKVEKWIDGIPEWSGYINDEVFTEPYANGSYMIHLTATDGMSILKGRYTELTGRHTHFDMIQECLDAIGLGLNIVDAIGITEAGHTAGGPLQQTCFDSTIFTEEKKRWILEKVLRDILKTYGANITQVHNKWVITNVESYYVSISGWEYTKDGVLVGVYSDTDEKVIDHILVENKVTLLTGGQIQKNKGWKELKVKKTFGKRDLSGIIFNGDFSKTRPLISSNPPSFIVEGWWGPFFYEEPREAYSKYFLKQTAEGDSYLFIDNEYGDYFYSDVDKVPYIAADTTNYYIFHADYAMLQSWSGLWDNTNTARIKIEVIDDSTIYYLQQDSETKEFGWTLVDTYIVIGKTKQQIQSSFKWIPLDIRVLGYPGGKIKVTLYNDHVDTPLCYVGIGWDNIKFYCEAVEQVLGNGVLIGEPTDNKFTEIPEEVEFTQNDILTENADYFFNNYLSLLDGTPTADWISTHHSGTLASIYLMAVLEAHGKSVQVKSIPGRGLITPHTRLIDHNGKKFQIISYSHSDKTNQFTCEAVEIIEPGTIPITSNIVMESSSSSGAAVSEATEPIEGEGATDDRLVSMLGANGQETGLPGRLHNDYFKQDYIMTNPVYIPTALSTLKSGKVVYNIGIHNVTFGTPFVNPYMVVVSGSTGVAGVNVIIISDSNLNYFTIKVPVNNTTVRWIAYELNNN